ncbi:patatin-like phospholipase family protein [Thalassotalea sp. HSM 43]|uniref:patatin-like phospholipase family protein n=1 Tax=Thalassotalea sp. HSM 43 TaxID=2552945 RepID=UPI001080334B|nr:patatin-like phospholipase family protein [Thalassotalea sp. HSM 43]QBY05436.1 patatin-like phospholipase family protein [Thalassotalea sp. HSM 43]
MAGNNKKSYKGYKNGLLLTGGGATAAYQVGVLKAISKFMPRNHGIPFPIISGTSAGAINATTIACYASCYHLGIRKLEYVWNNLHTSKIYHSNARKVFSHIISGIVGSYRAGYAPKKAMSLLNNEPLRQLLNQVVDFRRIDDNIVRGYLSSVALTASSYSTGDSISFYQADKSISPWTRAKRRGVQTNLHTDHLMASSAIPLIFPSVKIKKQHYGDGSISQLSPLSTPIHLGAERIFIVGVSQPQQNIHQAVDFNQPPTSAEIAGHLMDTVFTEALNSDLERLQRINRTLSLIEESKRSLQSPLKHIDTFMLSPSKNFHVIANEHYEELKWALRFILRLMGSGKDSDSSLMSYILFEQNYCKRLIQVGYEDAMMQEQNIREFLQL